MASDFPPLKRKRRGPYLQYLQTRNPLTAMPWRTRLRYRDDAKAPEPREFCILCAIISKQQ